MVRHEYFKGNKLYVEQDESVRISNTKILQLQYPLCINHSRKCHNTNSLDTFNEMEVILWNFSVKIRRNKEVPYVRKIHKKMFRIHILSCLNALSVLNYWKLSRIVGSYHIGRMLLALDILVNIFTVSDDYKRHMDFVIIFLIRVSRSCCIVLLLTVS